VTRTRDLGPLGALAPRGFLLPALVRASPTKPHATCACAMLDARLDPRVDLYDDLYDDLHVFEFVFTNALTHSLWQGVDPRHEIRRRALPSKFRGDLAVAKGVGHRDRSRPEVRVGERGRAIDFKMRR